MEHPNNQTEATPGAAKNIQKSQRIAPHLESDGKGTPFIYELINQGEIPRLKVKSVNSK